MSHPHLVAPPARGGRASVVGGYGLAVPAFRRPRHPLPYRATAPLPLDECQLPVMLCCPWGHLALHDLATPMVGRHLLHHIQYPCQFTDWLDHTFSVVKVAEAGQFPRLARSMLAVGSFVHQNRRGMSLDGCARPRARHAAASASVPARRCRLLGSCEPCATGGVACQRRQSVVKVLIRRMHVLA